VKRLAALIALLVLGACIGKPGGVTAPTTPERLAGTWNGALARTARHELDEKTVRGRLGDFRFAGDGVRFVS
jgi:hypothetical protein